MAVPNKKKKVFDGRYEVLEIVGRGSESVVYHAKHIASPSLEVALKVLISQKDNRSISDRLRKEALTLVSCRHRFVVRLDDFHSIEGLCYLALEYAPEGDLRKYSAKNGGKITYEEGERFLLQSLEALDFIHATGVIHRDMKPDNILVMDSNEIRIADFGLALLPGDEPSIAELQSGVGSFNYLPPEVLEGVRYDQRSDLYGLGLCFYEILAAKHPFEESSLAQQMETRRDDNVIDIREHCPGIPEKLASVIMKLLRYEAAERFQSAAEAERALRDNEINFDVPDFLGGASTGESDFSGYEAPPPAPAHPENADEPRAFDSDNTDAELEEELEEKEESLQRESHPTEKIDLERIKEIVDREEKRQQEIADRKARREKAEEDITQSEVELNSALVPVPNEENDEQPQKSRSERSPAPIPYGMRLLFTVVGAALAVIVGAKIIKMVTSSELDEDTVVQESPAVIAENETEEVTPAAEASITFPVLSAGSYRGTIKNLIPGKTLPFLIVSAPEKKALAVVVGIEGWSPVLVKTHTAEGTPLETVTISSNGLVFTLTADSQSGDEVSGTFVNSISQNIGIWSLKQAVKK